MRLTHRANGIEGDTIDKAEVAGRGRHVDVSEPRQRPVEDLRSRVLPAGFALTLDHHAVDDLGTTSPAIDEFGDHLGRMLEVAVHRDHCITRGEIEPRRERHLMPEVARQANDLESRLRAMELDGSCVRRIEAPVVDEDHLPARRERLEGKP